MAIQKSKTLSNGASGDYWRILEVSIDRQHMSVSGRIALFKDKATSDAGAGPLGAEKLFRFPLVLSELMIAPNAIAYMYNKIMEKASQVVSMDMLGHSIEPRAQDEDLAGGLSV